MRPRGPVVPERHSIAPRILCHRRRLEPGHIIAQVRRIRTKRIDEYGPIDPPSGISNADYLEWLKATRNAIASGHAPARPIRAIDEGARKRADELIAGVTDALPDIESA